MDCGCVIRWDGPNKDGNLWIHFCPLHQAAPDLLEAAKKSLTQGTKAACICSPQFTGNPACRECGWMKPLEAAIAKATESS